LLYAKPNIIKGFQVLKFIRALELFSSKRLNIKDIVSHFYLMSSATF